MYDDIFDYELIDCGDFRRIERFGDIVLDRPCPQARWKRKIPEVSVDARFERGKGWQTDLDLAKVWNVSVMGNMAQMRFSSRGQVGIFPEQWDNWRWISNKISTVDREIKILNGFAYTGMATLAASDSHTEVCHLDGAKSAVNWARENAEISQKSDHSIRWICDDIRTFLQREIKRGKHYDGIILDPPAFGRGAKKDWKIERDLPELMDLVSQVLSDNPLFVVLTCHAPEHFWSRDMARMLERLPQFAGQKAEEIQLEIPSRDGNSLISSFGARISL